MVCAPVISSLRPLRHQSSSNYVDFISPQSPLILYHYVRSRYGRRFWFLALSVENYTNNARPGQEQLSKEEIKVTPRRSLASDRSVANVLPRLVRLKPARPSRWLFSVASSSTSVRQSSMCFLGSFLTRSKTRSSLRHRLHPQVPLNKSLGSASSIMRS